MGLFSRLVALIEAKISGLLDLFENPREALDYSYKRQQELNQNVRKGIADVVTSKKRLELQRAKLEENVQRLNGQAREAVAASRDDLATIALQRKVEMMNQIDALGSQIATLQGEQDRLVATERNLEAKIEAFRAQKEVIKAQYSAAEAKVKIQEAATGLGSEMADAGRTLQRAQDKTEEMQARSEALDELVQQGTIEDVLENRDLVDRELSKARSDATVKSELAALKAESAREANA